MNEFPDLFMKIPAKLENLINEKENLATSQNLLGGLAKAAESSVLLNEHQNGGDCSQHQQKTSRRFLSNAFLSWRRFRQRERIKLLNSI